MQGFFEKILTKKEDFNRLFLLKNQKKSADLKPADFVEFFIFKPS